MNIPPDCGKLVIISVPGTTEELKLGQISQKAKCLSPCLIKIKNTVSLYRLEVYFVKYLSNREQDIIPRNSIACLSVSY